MREVKTSILMDLKDIESLEKLPDPIYNVVGIFLIPEDFAKNPESRSRSESVRESSAPKRVKKNTTRGLNNKSMNNEVEIFKDKYQTINKPQTQRIAQRSYVKGEVPIKDRRTTLDRTHELIKTDLAQTYTSPTRYQNNSNRLKQNNRFNLNLSAVRKVSVPQTKATPSTKKSDRQRLNTTYVNPSSSGFKEDSFLESRKKGRKKLNGVLTEALSPHTADRKNKQPTFGNSKLDETNRKEDTFNSIVLNSHIKGRAKNENTSPIAVNRSTSRRRERTAMI